MRRRKAMEGRIKGKTAERKEEEREERIKQATEERRVLEAAGESREQERVAKEIPKEDVEGFVPSARARTLPLATGKTNAPGTRRTSLRPQALSPW